MGMQIISGRVVFSRTVQPAQYESKKAEVELNFVLSEGEEFDATLDIVADHAISTVLAMVGLKPMSALAMAPKPVATEAPQSEPSGQSATADKATTPEACITAEQLNQLSTLITATNTDVDKFIEYIGYKDIELHNLPPDKFDDALAALRAKRERMEAAGQVGTPEATQAAPQQENAPAASARKPRSDAGVPRGPRTRKDGDASVPDSSGQDLTVDTSAAQERHPPERPEQFPEPHIQQSAEDYVKYVERWIKEMGADAAGMIKRWNNERDIRNSLAESIPASELTRLRSLIGTSSGADRKVAS
jgi:hypothetical protein